MKSLTTFFSGICLFCLFFCVTQPAFAEQKNPALAGDIMDAVEKKYARNSFEADFIQISTLEALDISEIASGEAAFSHPGKMRWIYLKPDRHEIITNGSRLWIYRPQENQVMQGEAATFFKSGGGGAFLSDITLIRKTYDIHLAETTDQWFELRLTAKKPSSDIASIQIWVSRQETLIQKVITQNSQGDTTVFEFSNIQFRTIPSDTFEFTPPAGVNIIDMNDNF